MNSHRLRMRREAIQGSFKVVVEGPLDAEQGVYVDCAPGTMRLLRAQFEHNKFTLHGSGNCIIKRLTLFSKEPAHSLRLLEGSQFCYFEMH